MSSIEQRLAQLTDDIHAQLIDDINALRSVAGELAEACRLLANVKAYGEVFPKGVLPAREAARAALIKWEAVK